MFESKMEGSPVRTNVVPLRQGDAAPLTPDECRRVRAMLVEFDAVKQSCPIARMILEKE